MPHNAKYGIVLEPYNKITTQKQFELDDDISLFDMIRDLQDAKMGDPRRLAYIMERIESDRPVYNSDEQYVREKFRQMRKELFSESEVPEPVPESVPEPTMQSKPTSKDGPSKAWYVLSVFLGLLGGVIAFAALRKRNRGMAYKNLGVGVGVTMILPMLVFGAYLTEGGSFTDEFDSKPVPKYTDEEVKRLAVTIPYESLVNDSEIHEGEFVQYNGTLIQVKKRTFGDDYVMRVGITQGVFTVGDSLWLNYKPTSDTERAWLDKAEDEPNLFGNDGEMITFWGISKGLTEYEGLLGNTVTVPEVDVIVLERHESDAVRVDPEPRVTTSGQPDTRHAISFSDIPAYVDAPTVERAVIDAVREWDMASPNVDFTLVESDADVNINWARYMPGSALGLHSASVTDDGTRERHSITVRLGIDDCHSKYQPFTHGTLQYIIAHEMGHYLGLRHVDDESHLMYSGEFFNVDSARVYDDLNLGIPYLERPEIATDAGLVIQAQIDELDSDLDQVSSQRQELKNASGNLDDNTIMHNNLVQKIQELEDQLACVNLT